LVLLFAAGIGVRVSGTGAPFEGLLGNEDPDAEEGEKQNKNN
jgi:hypothetical protein